MSDDWMQQYANPQPVAPEVKEKTSRARARIVVSLSVLAAIVGFGVAKVLVTSDDSAPAKTTAPPPVVLAVKHFSVAAPEKLGGRTLSTLPELVKAGTDAEATVRADESRLGTVLAKYYGTPKRDLVYAFAMMSTSRNLSMQLTLHFTFTQLTNAAGTKVVKAAEITDPGVLGGTGECGALDIQGTAAAYCGWADASTMGVLVFYDVDLAAAQKEFVSIREQIEKVTETAAG